jgi:subfamily B ATP-binding cassette protein MsbA
LSPEAFLLGLGAIGLSAIVLSAVCSWLIGRSIGRVTNRLIADYRNRLQFHLIRTDLQRMEEIKTGGMTSRIMTDPNNLSVLAGQQLVNSLGALFTLTVASVVLFWLNPLMALVSALCLPILVIAVKGMIGKIRPLARELREEHQKVTANLTETLGGARVVKAYHRENWESEKFSGESEGLLRRSLKILDLEINLGSVMGTLLGVVALSILLFGGVQILHGAMSIGDFVQFYTTLFIMLFPLGQLFQFVAGLQSGLAGLDRIEEVMAMEPEEAGDTARAPWPATSAEAGPIAFDHVAFRYAADKPLVLDDISFTAPRGTVTALVGPSGSGKSTLVHLIARFLKPTIGAIRIGGAAQAPSIDTVQLAAWRSHLGMVLQENYLFDGTIRENIAYARPEATDAEIKQAAELAHCTEFIDEFADGMATVVGERGIKLSGGQKQRISIARALIARPELLILDEATSSLDSESEAAIQDGMRTLIKDRTTFVIAHRLSTIRNADCILVLEKGRLIEQGKHEALMAKRGRYHAMYTAQYGIEQDRLRLPGDGEEKNGAEAVRGAPTPEASSGQAAALDDLPFLRPPTQR